MFFTLATTPDTRFPNQQELRPGAWLSHDDGWHTHPTMVAKGYANDRTLHQAATSQAPVRGNYCAFVLAGDRIDIRHDTDRAFPLWTDGRSITNLEPMGDKVLVDTTLSVEPGFRVSRQWRQQWWPTPALSDEEIVDRVHGILMETYESFLSNNDLPLKMFVTGGVDTVMAWAYLDHFTSDYELVDYDYLKFTKFYRLNHSRLKQFWGYRQTHLWSDDCVLVSGAMGDENFLRGPYTLEMMLRAHGTGITQVTRPGDYHHEYYAKVMAKGLDLAEPDTDMERVKSRVMDINTNDHQHWHLDQTLHFTPFKDHRIVSAILNSSRQQLVMQARNAHINRLLIERLDPDKLKRISRSKNHNSMENLL
jgi:hypothetical protein